MSSLSDTSGNPITDPVAAMGANIGTLRNRHIISRLLFILSAALTADLVYSIVAICFFEIWSLKISIPFFFEIFLLILLTREIRDWRLDHLASLFDNRFLLKDRLYSYIWYSRNIGGRTDIREAQASESLSSIDFPHILDQTRIRFPYYLMIVLLISGGLLYMTWNSEYHPPAVTTRIISSTVGTGHPPINPDSGPDRASRGPDSEQGADSIAPLFQGGMENGDVPSSASEALGDPDREKENEDPLTSGDLQQSEGIVSGETSAAAEISGQGHSGTGNIRSGAVAPPEVIKSIIESETVSEPIPPLLKNSSSFAFQELPDATRFLGLIPGQDGPSLASLDRETISNFEEGIDRFPDLYRDHLQTYYWELKKWDKNP